MDNILHTSDNHEIKHKKKRRKKKNNNNVLPNI
jgi:hypothetical protein